MPRPVPERKPRTLMETARVTPDERKRLIKAARRAKLPRSEFVRLAALREADAVLGPVPDAA